MRGGGDMAVGDHVQGPAGAPVFAKRGVRGDRVPPRPLPHFLAEMYGLPSSDIDPPASSSNDTQPYDEGPASELDCLRQVLAAPLLIAAEARSREVGIGADRVLIQWGVIDEAAYLQWLSRHTGIPLAERQELADADIRLHEPHLPHAAEHGLLPLRRDGELLWGIAPRGFSARHICRLSVAYPDMAPPELGAFLAEIEEGAARPEFAAARLWAEPGRSRVDQPASRELGLAFFSSYISSSARASSSSTVELSDTGTRTSPMLADTW